ncbi:MAG: hypothetical protein K2Y18_06835 [Alphaproteobacteria bacterium]|jgi:uncharacterized protein YcfJ|nr:hypothetical protein [Alphaproteobacteria bacterium]
MKQYLIAAVSVASIFVTACSAPRGPREESGMYIGGATGAIAGGLIGAAAGNTTGAIIGAGAGALAGGAIGKSVGAGMDSDDRRSRNYRY